MGGSLVPVSQYVLKVHSRCDLACDHCYVYESADHSWRNRPALISEQVVSEVARRIAEHVTGNGVRDVDIVLHGGEPLLAGVSGLRRVIVTLEDGLRDICRLKLRIHTNGVLLNEDFCELFSEHGVSVGISIDGDRAANDRHRRYRDGRSSYDQVVRAIRLIGSDRFRHLYAGLLCTIDVANDPVTVYRSLVDLRPPRVDFLLPHATWDTPPPRGADDATMYGDWLLAIFDQWRADGYPIQIRTFESILSTLAGGNSSTEALGLSPARLVVIETDGSYEQADSLKVAFDGAPATGMDVFSHSLDHVAGHPAITARQQGLDGLCRTCRECPVVTSCGGGLYAHRYKSGHGFENPSVYCADLFRLITGVSERSPRSSAKHEVSMSAFRELAAGFGGADAITQLAEAQRTLCRALLSAIYRTANVSSGAAQAAWDVLTRAEREDTEAVNAVLGHPYLRVWAVRTLERLKVGEAAPDMLHFAAFAASVAIRSGTRAVLTVPVIHGAVHMPGFGRLVIDAPESPTAELVADSGQVVVSDGVSRWNLGSLASAGSGNLRIESDGRSVEWQPVRTLEARGIRVALEDTDPYRDCHQWSAAPRLSDAEFGRWQRYFAAAWDEIVANHGVYAPAMAAGLGVLMPMSPHPDGRAVSAAARQAFGAVGVALPEDPVTLALLLIHEFQHVKLGAILDLYDLYDSSDGRLFRAPWREDLRPLEGLLQGTYAHLAVSDFWRTRGLLEEIPSGGVVSPEIARERFTHWRAHTADAIETLASSGSLTPLGVSFVNQMRQTVRD